MQFAKAARIILVGAPGVGKGTQSERLLNRFPQLSAISSGDLLRDNVHNKTPLGLQVQKLMSNGSLVPDVMILRLIFNELTTRGWLQRPANATVQEMFASSSSSQSEGSATTSPIEYSSNDTPSASYILDGFPRTASQATKLDDLVDVNLVVHLNTPKSIIMDRITNRWVHAPSGRVYNTTFNPPKQSGKDDLTGEPLTRRDDDSPETWSTRLKKFEETSMPLLEHYDKQGVVWRVDGNSSNEISPKLFSEIESRFGAT
ncbi:MAG: hypothetical protein M1828_001093 [Chrysothrix sp. TS-e1954]|nr:MAG: hypothetical protein M1828_001093 [Chrysothrix sp. TS-e1954]